MAGYYKGKISYLELKNMPIGEFRFLYYILYKKSLTKEGQDEQAAEKMQEVMEGLT